MDDQSPILTLRPPSSPLLRMLKLLVWNGSIERHFLATLTEVRFRLYELSCQEPESRNLETIFCFIAVSLKTATVLPWGRPCCRPSSGIGTEVIGTEQEPLSNRSSLIDLIVPINYDLEGRLSSHLVEGSDLGWVIGIVISPSDPIPICSRETLLFRWKGRLIVSEVWRVAIIGVFLLLWPSHYST